MLLMVGKLGGMLLSAPSDCKLCPLNTHRSNVVNMRIVGDNPQPNVLIAGEGPGIMEDSTGLSFVGPTGAYLKQELERRGIYEYALTNATRCYPGEIKKDAEMGAGVEACNPFLLEDIDEVHPKVILALGAYATKALGFDDPMGTILCHILSGPDGIPVVVSYHPAAFFRDPGGLHLFDLAVLKVRLLRDGLSVGEQWEPQLLTQEELIDKSGLIYD